MPQGTKRSTSTEPFTMVLRNRDKKIKKLKKVQDNEDKTPVEKKTEEQPPKEEPTASSSQNNDFVCLIRNELVCNICSKLFSKAVTLTCSHTFCKQCIERITKTYSKSCPICHYGFLIMVPTVVLDELTKRVEVMVKEGRMSMKLRSYSKNRVPSTNKIQEKSSSSSGDIIDNSNMEILEHHLTCTICSELFIKSVTLVCSHTFCTFCITKWKSKHSFPRCPLCRKDIHEVVPTRALDNFLDKFLERQTEETRNARLKTIEERENLPVVQPRERSDSTSTYDSYDLSDSYRSNYSGSSYFFSGIDDDDVDDDGDDFDETGDDLDNEDEDAFSDSGAFFYFGEFLPYYFFD